MFLQCFCLYMGGVGRVRHGVVVYSQSSLAMYLLLEPSEIF